MMTVSFYFSFWSLVFYQQSNIQVTTPSMKKIGVLLLFFTFIGLNLSHSYSQSFKVNSYNNEAGLPSNLCKWVEQDDEGFIWIATDAGLVRYDGKSFTSFSNDLPSLYVKFLFFEKGKGLYVLSDLGLGILRKDGFSYNYQSIIGGSGTLTDSTLYFPKSLFIDSKKSIWIGEPNSILNYSDGKIKRYPIDFKYRNDSFSRSFMFFEDKDRNLFAASWSGYLFWLNRNTNQFEELPLDLKEPTRRIYSTFFMDSDQVYFGTKKGVYHFSYSSQNPKQNKLEFKVELIDVNSITYLDGPEFLLGSITKGTYLWDSTHPSNRNLFKISKPDFTTINHISVSADKSVWVASDEGVAVMKRALFTPLHLDDEFPFNRSVSYIGNEQAIISNPDGAYKIQFNLDDEPVVTPLIKKPEFIIYSSDADKKNLWISLRDGNFDIYRNNKLERLITGSRDSRLSLLRADNQGSVWGYQEAKGNILKVNSDGKTKVFTKSEGITSSIQSISVTDKNQVYLGSTGNNSYLFVLDSTNGVFKNISLPISLDRKQELTVFDVEPDGNGGLFLGTNYGLFIYTSSSIKRIEFASQFGTPVIKAVKKDNSGKLFLGTERGLLVYNGNEVVSFEKEDGLPNATITPHGIIQTESGYIVFGTARGVGYSREALGDLKKTTNPVFLTVDFSVMNNESNPIAGTQLSTSFSCLSFPAEKTIYQFRILGLSDNWSEPSMQNQAIYSNLPTGEYKIQITAKQPGLLKSDISGFTFKVYPKWYFTWWMLTLYSALFILLVYLVSLFIQNYKIQHLKKRQTELEEIVTERTLKLNEEKVKTEDALELIKSQEQNLIDYIDQLKQAYKELTEANEIKNELLSVASHDLKNPLQSIMGYTEIIQAKLGNSPVSDRLSKIHQSAERMLKLVNNLLETTALESGKYELILKPTNLNLLTKSVISYNQPQASHKNQVVYFSIDTDLNYVVEADESRLGEALDNLVSNAIKYSPADKKIKVAMYGFEEKVRVEIQDEGPGLTDEDKTKLFGKFQRLSARPTAGETSTGLGLSIVKDVIELHHGKVWAESEVGRGSTFIVELPLLTEIKSEFGNEI